MRDLKSFAGGIDELPLQRILGGKCDRVQHHVERAKFFANALEHMVDIFIASHIARIQRCVSPEGADQILDIFLEPFTLVSERECCAGFIPRLRDRPRDRPPVGHPEHNTLLARQRLENGLHS